jgi:hypothetical protein|tara:strand:- start:1383 stop:1991 length:609 start_codon:yes stop_codon:yes gene_type:complete
MALTNYTTIKAVIQDYLDRSDLASQLTDFMTLAENRIYRDLRVSAMETALSATISSGTIAVPTGYLEMKYAYINASPTSTLQRKDLDYIYTNYPTRSADGKPAYYARQGTNFIFGPYPNSNYSIAGIYYKKLTVLTGTGTNFITADIPEALIFGALVEAEPFLQNDERIPMWENRYQQTIKAAQAQDDGESLSGSPLAVSSS